MCNYSTHQQMKELLGKRRQLVLLVKCSRVQLVKALNHICCTHHWLQTLGATSNAVMYKLLEDVQSMDIKNMLRNKPHRYIRTSCLLARKVWRASATASCRQSRLAATAIRYRHTFCMMICSGGSSAPFFLLCDNPSIPVADWITVSRRCTSS